MPRAKKEFRVAVADCETDPFLYDRVPKPFSIGFYDGDTYIDFWGDDCFMQFAAWLKKSRFHYRIYFHNGGKFDFFMFLEHLENPIKIISSRIVQAKLFQHELRDSYAIIPIPLKSYKKDETDYSWFERENREKYKTHILEYLRSDCVYLFDLVSAFCKRFGDQLTVGGTAIKELQKLHPFLRGTKEHDTQYRHFYFGGRVEYWAQGILKGKFRVFDINSAYPYVMRNYRHPTGTKYIIKENPQITDKGEIRGFEGAVYFAEIEGQNFGALPVRTKEGLDFNVKQGTFFATCHELRVAVPRKLFKIDRCVRAYICMSNIQFKEYVDTHYKDKTEASKRKKSSIPDSDEYNRAVIDELFAKFLLNSAYGKFGQNPENYFDWLMLPSGDIPPDLEHKIMTGDDDGSPDWEIHAAYEQFGIKIWKRPITKLSFFDVATAASITGGTRAVLLEAIASSTGVVYCDTDSIILSGEFGAEINPAKLGAWKHEADFDLLAIAGKKMYAGFLKGKCQKFAFKGMRGNPEDILAACEGKTVLWKKDSPSFKLSGQAVFLERSVKMTRKNLQEKSVR